MTVRMKENTQQRYIDAHDKAWDGYVRGCIPYQRNQWEAFAWGFAAGVRYGRTYPNPEGEVLCDD